MIAGVIGLFAFTIVQLVGVVARDSARGLSQHSAYDNCMLDRRGDSTYCLIWSHHPERWNKP